MLPYNALFAELEFSGKEARSGKLGISASVQVLFSLPTEVVNDNRRYRSPALAESTPNSQLRILGQCLRMRSFRLIS